MNEFVLRSGELAQGFLAGNFKIFSNLCEIHKKARVIPRERWLSTGLSTVWSTVWSTVGPTASPVGTDDWDGRSVRGAESRTKAIRQPGPGQAYEEDARKCRIRKRGPSMYEMEGPRSGHLTGLPITRLPGCYPAAPPEREISLEGQFPGFPCARPDVPVSRPDGVRGPS